MRNLLLSIFAILILSNCSSIEKTEVESETSDSLKRPLIAQESPHEHLRDLQAGAEVLDCTWHPSKKSFETLGTKKELEEMFNQLGYSYNDELIETLKRAHVSISMPKDQIHKPFRVFQIESQGEQILSNEGKKFLSQGAVYPILAFVNPLDPDSETYVHFPYSTFKFVLSRKVILNEQTKGFLGTLEMRAPDQQLRGSSPGAVGKAAGFRTEEGAGLRLRYLCQEVSK